MESRISRLYNAAEIKKALSEVSFVHGGAFKTKTKFMVELWIRPLRANSGKFLFKKFQAHKIHKTP
jgi:hypothetical protein